VAVDQAWLEGVRERNQRKLGLSGLSGLGASPQEIVSRFRAVQAAAPAQAPGAVRAAAVAPAWTVAAAPSGWVRWLLAGAGVLAVGGVAYAMMRR
jgi:hypothetical protein